MAQPFTCLCSKPTCRGRISGARDMTDAQLSGIWLNGHIRELLEEQRGGPNYDNSLSSSSSSSSTTNTNTNTTTVSPTNAAFTTASSVNGDSAAYTTSEQQKNVKTEGGELDQIAQSLRDALTHAEKVVEAARNALVSYVGAVNANGAKKEGVPEGAQRRGPTSRELSGEMGGDTEVVV